MAKTSIISSQKISDLVREKVLDAMREILSDPDLGLDVSASFTRRLKKSIRDKKAGRTTSLSRVFKQYSS